MSLTNSKLQDDINNIPLADDDPQGKFFKAYQGDTCDLQVLFFSYH